MKTEQPQWIFKANLGDVHPLEYGGAFVYVDKTGVYSPELVIFDGFEDTTKKGAKTEVSRIVCERCTLTDGVLSDNKFHPLHPAWFAGDKLASAAKTMGITLEELQEKLCSEDPVELAFAYYMLTQYHGCFEFDQYPEEKTRTEIRRAYRAPFRK